MVSIPSPLLTSIIIDAWLFFVTESLLLHRCFRWMSALIKPRVGVSNVITWFIMRLSAKGWPLFGAVWFRFICITTYSMFLFFVFFAIIVPYSEFQYWTILQKSSTWVGGTFPFFRNLYEENWQTFHPSEGSNTSISQKLVTPPTVSLCALQLQCRAGSAWPAAEAETSALSWQLYLLCSLWQIAWVRPCPWHCLSANTTSRGERSGHRRDY